jgi:cytochrome bd ubiquinol oxidase subunit II
MTPQVDLATIWFILVGVLFTGYAVLDGFDLGVGTLHLLTRQDEHRRILLNAIGPVWDGNEVWLVTGGGALFAAFPLVYATVFSGFYLAFMLLLLGLILRAVAIEFRSKRASPAWRRTWDVCFAIGSGLSALLVGVALGNIAQGVPLDSDFEFGGTFLSLLNPYALTVGLLTVALFAMHGAIYLVMKTEGDLQDQFRGWIRPSVGLVIVLTSATTLMTLARIPHMTDTIRAYPVLLAIPLAGALATVNILREVRARRELRAFLSSCTALVCLMALFGIGMYPDLVYSSPAPEHSLTVLNATSSQTTLGIMLVIAALGVPLVIAYTASIYWIYRGKVRLDASSY